MRKLPHPNTSRDNSLEPSIPRLREVQMYFSEKELPEVLATAFFRLHAKADWKNRAGNPINSKQAAFRWRLRIYHDRPWLYNRKVRQCIVTVFRTKSRIIQFRFARKRNTPFKRALTRDNSPFAGMSRCLPIDSFDKIGRGIRLLPVISTLTFSFPFSW
jgi:hypothetical protein